MIPIWYILTLANQNNFLNFPNGGTQGVDVFINKMNKDLLKCTFAATLGGLLFGYDIVIINGAMLDLVKWMVHCLSFLYACVILCSVPFGWKLRIRNY